MEAHLYRELASLEETHWWFQGRRTVIRSVLEKHLKPGVRRRILDAGCGTGGMLGLLREFGETEGLEGSEEALRFCRERVGDSVRLLHGRIPDDIPGEPTFDVISSFDVLEHLPEPVTALSAIRRALKPDGLFVCTVPAFQFLWSAHDEVHHHHRRYTEPMLREQLQRAGLRVRWISYFNSLLFPPIAAVRVLEKLLPERDGKSDLGKLPMPVNALLGALFKAERFLVPRFNLPFGVSLIALAERADARA
ncbi:MAG: class I SAM-dependent methyltransferase [Myxococcaceae bacterium]